MDSEDEWLNPESPEIKRNGLNTITNGYTHHDDPMDEEELDYEEESEREAWIGERYRTGRVNRATLGERYRIGRADWVTGEEYYVVRRLELGDILVLEFQPHLVGSFGSCDAGACLHQPDDNLEHPINCPYRIRLCTAPPPPEHDPRSVNPYVSISRSNKRYGESYPDYVLVNLLRWIVTTISFA